MIVVTIVILVLVMIVGLQPGGIADQKDCRPHHLPVRATLKAKFGRSLDSRFYGLGFSG